MERTEDLKQVLKETEPSVSKPQKRPRSKPESFSSGGVCFSTAQYYLRKFCLFWRWLNTHHPETLNSFPPTSIFQSFDEFKEYPICPIKIEAITPEIYFEYVGTNDVSRYTKFATVLKNVLSKISCIYGEKHKFDCIIRDIKRLEIPKPKNVEVFDPQQSIETNIQALLYMKAVAYKQWQILESMTPGMS